MSASLVGSEMCIRDSQCTLRGKAALMCRTLQDSTRELSGQRYCSGAEIPVSYTHLTLPTICSV
eukprot:11511299-Alexandrium_andersonii.AAC.1